MADEGSPGKKWLSNQSNSSNSSSIL